MAKSREVFSQQTLSQIFEKIPNTPLVQMNKWKKKQPKQNKKVEK